MAKKIFKPKDAYKGSFDKCLPWLKLDNGLKIKPFRHWGMLYESGESDKIILEKVPAPHVFCAIRFKKGLRKTNAVLFYPGKFVLGKKYTWGLFPDQYGDESFFNSWKKLVNEGVIPALKIRNMPRVYFKKLKDWLVLYKFSLKQKWREVYEKVKNRKA